MENLSVHRAREDEPLVIHRQEAAAEIIWRNRCRSNETTENLKTVNGRLQSRASLGLNAFRTCADHEHSGIYGGSHGVTFG